MSLSAELTAAGNAPTPPPRRDRPPHWVPLLALAASAALALAVRGPAQPAGDWLGAEVVPRSAATASRLGGKGACGIYRVEQVDGERLRLAPISATAAGATGGWVVTAEVVRRHQAVGYFSERIRDEPESAWAYHRRALAWADQDDTDTAIADYGDAIRLDPSDPRALADRGLAWLARADPDRALADLDEAIRLDPSDPRARDHRGLVRLAVGGLADAVADFSEAIRLDPKAAPAYGHRGMARARLRRYDAAVADFDEALRLDPGDPASCNAFAWLLATCPVAEHRDGPRAVALARRANELTGWRAPDALGTLAAASALAGDFDAAVRWQSRALEQFPEDDPDLQGHRARLEVYRAKKPYYEGQRS